MNDKLFIENVIFYVAAKQSCAIWSCKGRLISPAADDFLAQLIVAYNGAFGEENAVCVALSEQESYQEQLAHYEAYLREQSRNPLAASFHLIKKRLAV